MKKIISLFKRNYETDRMVRNEITEGAEWVIEGKGVATKKQDGTACLVLDGRLYKRFDCKKGKTPPLDFLAADEADPVTGHWPGWVPVGNGADDRWHREAWERFQKDNFSDTSYMWTYELCGPRIQGNPELLADHRLLKHGAGLVDAPRDYEGLKKFFSTEPIEGIVWWENLDDVGCRKVKIKARDFGLTRKLV